VLKVVDELEINMLGPFVHFCISMIQSLKQSKKLRKKLSPKNQKVWQTTIFM
jgi:hypothetical protein